MLAECAERHESRQRRDIARVVAEAVGVVAAPLGFGRTSREDREQPRPVLVGPRCVRDEHVPGVRHPGGVLSEWLLQQERVGRDEGGQVAAGRFAGDGAAQHERRGGPEVPVDPSAPRVLRDAPAERIGLFDKDKSFGESWVPRGGVGPACAE